MTNEETQKAIARPPLATPERRFPKAAVDYVDTLLEVQRKRFEAEQAFTPSGDNDSANWPQLPAQTTILAEGDTFVGSGWGPLDYSKSGEGRRWMARMATLLLAADLSSGGQLALVGGGHLKRRYVDDLQVWIDNIPIQGTIKKSFSSWHFAGVVPPMEQRPFHVLGLQTKGGKPFKLAPKLQASLALSEVTFLASSQA